MQCSRVEKGWVLLVALSLLLGVGGEGLQEARGWSGEWLRPVPEEMAQVDARRGLRTTFAKEYADVSVAGKRRLAGMLMRQAGMAAADAAIYVMLSEVKDLAVGCGEVELALQAADELGRQFKVDGAAVKFATMQACARSRLSPGQATVLARAARGVAEVRLAADDFEGASRAASVADEAARGCGDTSLQTDVAMLAEFCRDAVRQAPAFRMAMETLSKEPENATASQQAGEFLVFVKQEWGRGLLLLSKGTDEGLKKAASAELARARGAELAEAAEVWAKQAEKKRGPSRQIALRHARALFEAAASDLSGEEKGKCLERVGAMVSLYPVGGELADTGAARSALGELRWGL